MQARTSCMILTVGLLGGCTAARLSPAPGTEDTSTVVLSDDDDDDDGDDDDDDTGLWSPYSLMSLNLHCLITGGTGFDTNEDRFDEIARAASVEEVAVIAVQEACVSDTESAVTLLEAALEAETGEDWSAHWAEAHVAWQGTPDEALEGLAVFVRGEGSDPAALTYQAQTGLVRVGVAVTLPEHLGSVRVHSVHLSVLDEDIRHRQAREAASSALAEVDPGLGIVIAGDLNARAGTPAHDAFGALGFDDLSADLAADRIDHAFAHGGAALQATEARLIFDDTDYAVVSDHPGVVVRLEPSPPVAVSITRIGVNTDVGAGHYVTVRGDVEPLSWDLGWPAFNRGNGRWDLVLPGLSQGSFGFKALIDDVTWQQGDDVVGTAGADHEITPVF